MAPIIATKEKTDYGSDNPYPKYDEEVLQKFCEIIKEIKHRTILGAIDIHTPLLDYQERCYTDDPIHPNKNGHQLIMETVIDHLTI
jgi:hypothetical protein